ncbi:lITAF domain-containing protein [Denticeps clupeoides]|uniref:LITAF domain-containing protein n=1 Tax=Denticeps clupeoides TaxID=299321 RepID=A0AAY4D2G2_9TELE|nr:cell death-inducing p53-target protein 1 [Denticeps clupeoides]
MASERKMDPPPYVIPMENKGDSDVRVYHVHTPFTPPSSTIERLPDASDSASQPVSAFQSQRAQKENVPKFVSTDNELHRSPAMTTCINCQQQVLTNVTYKVGAYAWLMCILFILCGLVIGCCLIPFFMKHFKDVYHSCPRCHRVLHVEKKKCCS